VATLIELFTIYLGALLFGINSKSMQLMGFLKIFQILL
jgi:hypothetical protein